MPVIRIWNFVRMNLHRIAPSNSPSHQSTELFKRHLRFIIIFHVTIVDRIWLGARFKNAALERAIFVILAKLDFLHLSYESITHSVETRA